MTVSAYTKARLEDELSGNGLPPLWNRALALLVESHLTLPQIAKELGINRQRLWEIRKDPEFQAAYRTQMAILESSTLQYAIASRVECISALDRRWRHVNASSTTPLRTPIAPSHCPVCSDSPSTAAARPKATTGSKVNRMLASLAGSRLNP